jgi:hypothetical protein
MLRTLLGLAFLCHTFAQLTFDPGCSFSNGQCIYNVKLGHEGQCDVAGKRAAGDNSPTASTEFQVHFISVSVIGSR